MSETDYYDCTAPGYNELHREEQMKKIEIILKNIEVKEDDYLLDVGCGTGLSSELFNCKKMGIDSSAEMIKHAKIPAIKAKAEKIPFDDRIFDIVICVTAIHNFDDIEQAIKEIERVGRDRFVITVLKKSRKKDLIEALLRSLFDVKKAVEEDKDDIFFCKKKK